MLSSIHRNSTFYLISSHNNIKYSIKLGIDLQFDNIFQFVVFSRLIAGGEVEHGSREAMALQIFIKKIMDICVIF